MKSTLIPVVVVFITGIITSAILSIPDAILLPILCLALAALLLFVHHRKSLPAFLCLLVTFFIIGMLDLNIYRYHSPSGNHICSYISQDKLTLEGVISELPQASSGKTELIVSVSRILTDGPAPVPVHGKVLLAVKPSVFLNYGDVIRFKTRLRTPNNFNNPGGFDYAGYLRYRGILVRGFIAEPSNIVIIREGYGNPFLSELEVFRNRIKQLIDRHEPSPVNAIIQASILGNQKEIPREIMDKFNLTGTSHIIAISGFNMGIVALFAIFVTRLVMKSFPWLLLRFNWQRVSAVVAAILVIAYTFIAGAGISVVRATLMILVFMCAILLGKIRDLGNTLALAALIILMVSPYDLYDVSFQLSFSAVMALIFIAPRLMRFIPETLPDTSNWRERLVKKCLRSFLVFIVVTLSATLGTLPLIIFYFNRLSTIVLLSNLLVVPILGVIAIPVCMAIIIFAPFSETVAFIFIKIAGFLVKVSLGIVEYLASLPYASIIVTTPNLLEIIAYYLLIYIGMKLLDDWHTRKAADITDPSIPLKTADRQRINNGLDKWRRIGLFTCFGLLVVFFIGDAFYVCGKNYHPGLLKMTAIDVGQGSSTLIRFPGGKIVLVDGGGFYDDAFDTGKYVLAPFLLHERISTVHVVAFTHPHPDHMYGLKYIIENFNVQEVWANQDLCKTEDGKAFLRLIEKRKISLRLMSAQTGPLKIDGVDVRVLNPRGTPKRKNDEPSFNETNDNALVIRTSFRNVQFLLPADISSSVEEALIDDITDIQSQILIIPHHGSRHSSSDSFLRKVQPKMAILSVGKDNLFHLPHPDTLARYRARSIPIFRTDRHGAVTVITDGVGINVHTFEKGF